MFLQLDDLKSKHSGRIFIFGTGPSLINQLPLLKQMEGRQTFGINGLCFWEDLPFVPIFYSCQNNVVGRGESPDDPPFTDYRFMITRAGQHVELPNWVQVCKQRERIGCFDDDPKYLLHASTTGAGMPAQIAAWMGFDPIYLLGVDHREGSAYCYSPNVRRPHKYDERKMDQWVTLAEAFARAGRNLYSSTPMSGLNGILEYVPLEDALA
jgi:hypothetical protein